MYVPFSTSFKQSFSLQVPPNLGKVINNIDDNTLDILMNYYWPGNVRELENVIEYSVVRAKEETIRLENLPPSIRSTYDKKKPVTEFKQDNPSELLQLLEKHKWNKTKVAEELGIGRTTLWRMLKKIENNLCYRLRNR